MPVNSSTRLGRTASLRKFEKWLKIDDGGATRYPLCDEITIRDIREMAWLYGDRREWFRHHFPELWCWLQLNASWDQWEVGYRSPIFTIDLLLVTSLAEVFESAWQDSIDETV